jgi:hypothetical protein
MDEVVAVTGIDGEETGIEPCSSCHYGSEVGFSTATNEPTLNPYAEASDTEESEIVSAGASSYTTSVMSGLAALVWSKYPRRSRDKVISRLISASAGEHRDDGLGWIGATANCAVGDLCENDTYTTGPKIIEDSGTYTWEVHFSYTGDRSLSYDWQWVNEDGSTNPMSGSRTASRFVELSDSGRDEYPEVRVTVTEEGTGETITTGKGLIVRAKDSQCSGFGGGDCDFDTG